MELIDLFKNILEQPTATINSAKIIEVLQSTKKAVERICPTVTEIIEYSTDNTRNSSSKLLQSENNEKISRLLEELYEEDLQESKNDFDESRSPGEINSDDNMLLRNISSRIISILALSDEHSDIAISDASFECLSALIQLRVVLGYCSSINTSWNKTNHLELGSNIGEIMPYILNEFCSPFNRRRNSALDFAKLLLICPREECTKDFVRDAIMVQLVNKGGSAMLAAAELLSYTVTAASSAAVYKENCDAKNNDGDEMDALQRQIKSETMALSELQNFSHALDEIIHKLNDEGSNTKKEEDFDTDNCDALVKFVAHIYQLAPDAVRGSIEEQCGKNSNVIIAKVLGTSALADKDSEHQHHHDDQEEHIASFDSPSDSGESSEDLPALISSVKDPITINDPAELQMFFEAISEDLSNKNTDLWKNRLEALVRVERLVMGENFQIHGSSVMISHFRVLPIQAQIEDLRSQITRQACKLVVCLAYTLNEGLALLAELWFPAMLKLAISGVRIMAQQGENCILQVCALGGTGYSRVIPLLCDGCINKHHQNHKKCCVMALTVALRVWSNGLLERHSTAISKAVHAACNDRDPDVRQEARKGFWALQARFKIAGEKLMRDFDFQSRKRVEKMKDLVNSEWEEGGTMQRLTLGHEPVERDLRSGSMHSARSRSAPRGSMTKSDRPKSKIRPPRAGSVDRRRMSSPVRKCNSPARSASSEDSSTKKFNSRMSLPAANYKTGAPLPRSRKADVPKEVRHSSALKSRRRGQSPLPSSRNTESPQSKIKKTRQPSEANISRKRTDSSIERSGPGTRNGIPLSSKGRRRSSPAPSLRSLSTEGNRKAPQRRSHLARPSSASNHQRDKGTTGTNRKSLMTSTGGAIQSRKSVSTPSDYGKRRPSSTPTTQRSSKQVIKKRNSVLPDSAEVRKFHESKKEEHEFSAAKITTLKETTTIKSSVLLSPLQGHSAENKLNSITLPTDLDEKRDDDEMKSSDDCRVSAASYSNDENEPANDSSFKMSGMNEERINGKSLNVRMPSGDNSIIISSCHNQDINNTSKSEATSSHLEAPPPPLSPVSFNGTSCHKILEEKDSNIMKTPPFHSKSNGSDSRMPRTPLTDPILRFMARPSPLSADKLSRDSESDMKSVITKLSTDSPDDDKFIGMQALLQLARQPGSDELWENSFALVLDCILDGFGRKINGDGVHLADNLSLVVSESSSSVSETSTVQHLYLQGMRALIKYQPDHVLNYIDTVVDKLLKCSRNSAYEVVHTAERALENIVSNLDPARCFQTLIPYLNRSHFEDENSLSIVLSALRTLVKLVGRVPASDLSASLPSIMPCIFQTVKQSSVDMRKATVFVIVEIYCVLREAMAPYLLQLNPTQLKLVTIYIERKGLPLPLQEK